MITNISRNKSALNPSYDKMMAHTPASECNPWLVVLILECLATVILNIITIIVFVKQRQVQRRSTYLIIQLGIVDRLTIVNINPSVVFACVVNQLKRVKI